MVENPPPNINKLPLTHLFAPPQIPLLPEGKLQDRMPPTPTGALSPDLPPVDHCTQQ